MKFEVFIKSKNLDGSVSKFGISHMWTADSFGEAEEKSKELLSKSEFIWKIEVDF